MKQIETNYEAMYWTAQSEVATLKAEAVTLRADYDNIEADARELAADNETLKGTDADLRKELGNLESYVSDRDEEIRSLVAENRSLKRESMNKNEALKASRKTVKLLEKELDAAWQAEPARMNNHVEDTYTLSRQFTVLLAGCKDKIEAIKAVRHITPLGLKEAKDLVEAAPTHVMREVSFAKATEANKILKKAGATVYVV
jgi:large subunit ribosomal protein L7/L12